MKEYRIITWDADLPGEPEPWAAFICPPKADPAEYFAEWCGLLANQGLLCVGRTEGEAVEKLFGQGAISDDLRSDVIKIFEKNTAFSIISTEE